MNWTELGQFIGNLIVMCFVIYTTIKAGIKKYGDAIFEKDNKKTNVMEHNKTNIQIQDRLDNIRELLNADSARVHLIHNGSHYLSGVSSLKVNCAWEALKYGIKSHQIMLNEVPVTISAAFIEKLWEKTVINCPDLEHCVNLPENLYKLAPFASIEREIGNQALSAILLCDEDKSPMGFITIGYENKDSYIENNAELYKLATFVEDKLHDLMIVDQEPKKNVKSR